MFQDLLDKIKKLDSKTKTIMKYGFITALVVSIISCMILFTYETIYASPDLYYIGLQMFKTSLIIGISFFICGFAVDTIKKEIVH